MHRRVVAALAVVALVGLSGCSALPVFDGPDASPTPSPTASGTPTPTTDPLEYPAGYDATGVVDVDAAVTNHERALAGYESYQYRFDVGVGSGNGTTDAFVYLLRVDHADERAYQIRDDGDAARFQYYENDRLYAKLDVDGNVSYDSTDHEYDRAEFSGIQFIAPLFAHVEYRGSDVRETDNGTFYRYRSERVTDPEAILPADTTAEEIESFEVTLVVHEDGAVRGASYRVVTTQGTELAAIATVGSINATTVDRPDWYDEAAPS